MENAFISPGSNYIPNPEAARILARLIEFGFVPSPPPQLPPEWAQAFEATLRMSALGRRRRRIAFIDAIKGLPFEMYQEVQGHLAETEDRAARNRIFYDAEDALHPPPPLTWIVQGLLAASSLNLLVGNPGTKKTLTALDLAVCVALGKPWLGRPVTQAPIVYVDEETGISRLWGRMNAVLTAHQGGYDTPIHYVSLGNYDLRAEADAEELTNRALSFDARLIVFDTLSGIMRGGDENSVTSVQPLLYHLRRMAEYCQAAILILHHTNRLGGFRGSSALAAAVDLLLITQSDPGDTLIRFHAPKARHLMPPPFCARANFENSSEGEVNRFHLSPAQDQPVAKAQPPRENTATAVLDFLADTNEADIQQIVSRLGDVALGTVRNTLHQLTSSALIERADGGNKGKKATYKLSAKGRELFESDPKVLTINESPVPQDDDY